jgi:NhaP-type Na+/H+ or K+/H+ antiporter
METSFNLSLQIVIAVISGIGAQVLGELLKVPSIVFLLLFGILLGRDGVRIIHPHDLGIGLEVLVTLSVAVILFEGGLNLKFKELGEVSGSLRNLVTFGTLITLIGGGISAHYLGEFPWSIAFLYASLVVVTGPTVISSLLKQVNVDRQVATLLEGEGVLIDPVGAILAVVVLDTILNNSNDIFTALFGLTIRLGIGAIIGGLGGWFLGWFLKKAQFLSDDLKTLIVLAGLWGIFGLSQYIRSESGLMSTVVAGLIFGSFSLPEERLVKRFKGQLTILAVSVLFILLAADLSLASVLALGWGSLWTVLTLMFIVRPISIFICTFNSQLNWQQKLFLSWVAPRGIVSASVASLFSILLTQKGLNGGAAIKALVFLTILLTVFMQGLTAGIVAKWLKITSESAKGAVIIGCNPLSILIAKLLTERAESVILIDSDETACKEAEKEHLPVLLKNALDVEILQAVGLDEKGTFLAMTNNGQVNIILAERAALEFKTPRILAVFPDVENEPNNNGKINQAFINETSIKNWNEYLTTGEVKLGKILLTTDEFTLQQANLQALIRTGELIPLLLIKDEKIAIMPDDQEWQSGDEIIYLLHDPRPKLLKRLSGSNNSYQLPLNSEQLPINTPQSSSL